MKKVAVINEDGNIKSTKRQKFWSGKGQKTGVDTRKHTKGELIKLLLLL